jgi:hypothetical protein
MVVIVREVVVVKYTGSYGGEYVGSCGNKYTRSYGNECNERYGTKNTGSYCWHLGEFIIYKTVKKSKHSVYIQRCRSQK